MHVFSPEVHYGIPYLQKNLNVIKLSTSGKKMLYFRLNTVCNLSGRKYNGKSCSTSVSNNVVHACWNRKSVHVGEGVAWFL